MVRILLCIRGIKRGILYGRRKKCTKKREKESWQMLAKEVKPKMEEEKWEKNHVQNKQTNNKIGYQAQVKQREIVECIRERQEKFSGQYLYVYIYMRVWSAHLGKLYLVAKTSKAFHPMIFSFSCKIYMFVIVERCARFDMDARAQITIRFYVVSGKKKFPLNSYCIIHFHPFIFFLCIFILLGLTHTHMRMFLFLPVCLFFAVSLTNSTLSCLSIWLNFFFVLAPLVKKTTIDESTLNLHWP